MTDLSRRSVLASGALGAAVAPFVPSGSAQAAKPRAAYSRARFLAQRGRRFTVRGGRGRWSARLRKVTDLSSQQRGDDQAFGLVFRFRRPGPDQSTVTVERPRFAPVQLFLVPTDARRRTYYAVVNRSV
jgi:hypothetical protein